MMNSWFPVGRNDSPGWRLDIVSLLAVIGESSISVHAQEITSSWLCLLPRLIPAPQALLRSSRPLRVYPAPPCTIIGVHSGSTVNEINFFANIIHDVNNLKAYDFQEYDVSWEKKHAEREEQRTADALAEKVANTKMLAQQGKEVQSATLATSTGEHIDIEKVQGGNVFRRFKIARNEDRPLVPPKHLSPMNLITILSFLLSVGLFVWAALIQDGTAMLAIAFVSLAASMVGLGQWWRPRLAKRWASSKVPDGDLVIRTRVSAFIVVRCKEPIARELYIAPETCDYWIDDQLFPFFSGIGMVLLMVAIVLLGNCTWTMQAAIGGTYLLLNGLYWIASLQPKGFFWDMSRYQGRKPSTALKFTAALKTDSKNRAPNYTRALWYAIYSTKRINWVINSGAAPNTKAWNEWLSKALVEANKNNADWDAEEAKDILMATASEQKYSDRERKVLVKEGLLPGPLPEGQAFVE